MSRFEIHWILANKRIYLPQNVMSALPNVGDEIRAGVKTFYRVERRVWCLDEDGELGQRVNIELEKITI